MRLVCQYRQQLFNCGHVVFHRSYATAGGRNKSVLVAVPGLEEPSSVGDGILSGMFLVLAVTVHMLHDIKEL
jgi:hypothetical protein